MRRTVQERRLHSNITGLLEEEYVRQGIDAAIAHQVATRLKARGVEAMDQTLRRHLGPVKEAEDALLALVGEIAPEQSAQLEARIADLTGAAANIGCHAAAAMWGKLVRLPDPAEVLAEPDRIPEAVGPLADTQQAVSSLEGSEA